MLTKYHANPIFSPIPQSNWQNLKVYNPGILYENGVFHMFYNAVGDDWILRIGKATSKDGINFQRDESPILIGEMDYEIKGVMDPRITKIENTYYVTYSADDGITRKLALATSADLVHWEKHGLMLTNWDTIKAGAFRNKDGKRYPEFPERSQRSKAGAIFPKKINEEFVTIFGNSNLWMAKSKDGIHYDVNFTPFLKPRDGDFFDNLSVQGGPPPIHTDNGWLIFYHGKSLVSGDYKIGYLILDLNDPTKILYRCKDPILFPTEKYEFFGIVDLVPGGVEKMKSMNEVELKNYLQQCYQDQKMPKVVFCCGAVVVDDKINIYYGASDTSVCLASCELDDIRWG